MWCSCFLLLLFFHHHAPTSITAAILPKFHDATTDRDALLSFRSLISDDPSKALASWNNKSLDFCQWRGVTCAGRKHPQRVIALKLDSFGLAGSMSPSLANLTFLRSISLSNNGFHGRIPQELGFLHRLRHLDFTMNSLGGGIPATLGLCFNLRNLSLGSNKLQGPIPNELGSLTKLVQLTLENNSLVGSIPPSITNLSSLAYLSLSHNYLSGGIPPTIGMLTSLTFLNLSNNTLSGSIPPSITNLSSLGPLFLSFNAFSGGIPPNIDDLLLLIQLDLSRNELSGVIPPSLGNISSLSGLDLSDNTFSGGIPPSLGLLTNLTYLSLQSDNLSGVVPPSIWNLSALVTFDLASNQLHGTIPENIGHSLPNLEYFYLYLNEFHGPIPLSLSNASGLINVELNGNRFRGKIPSNLGNLKYLSYLILRENELEATTVEDWSFLAALTNCTSLEALQLDFNMLGGILPRYMANLSTTLRLLTMEGNEISGRLPTKLENLMSLGLFVMAENYLIGTIPSSIGILPGLYKLDLGLNSLSGEIPSMFGNCTTLSQIFLDSNDLNGSIPTTLANCQHLEALNLQNNKLTGTIPKEVLAISSFSMFLVLSHNSLIGTIPSEVGSLINLQLFDVSENMLSGNIPDSLGKCQLLEYVYLQGNFFNGTIPSSLSTLEGMLKLDLSKNNLTGPIPKFLGELRGLYYLNLSFNKLEGEVPEVGVFANASAVSVLGNNLCGGNQELHLPPCSFPSPSSKHNSYTLQIVIPISSTALILILIFGLFVIHCRVQGSRRRDNAATGMRDRHMKISYHELAKATDGFSPANLIGTGSFGSAHRGILQDDSHKIVAVKVLNLQQRGASKSFISECEVLRNIRHRNLIKIVTSCSSVDFQGNDFKALVYEYMPNGSLDDWLHPMENALENEFKNLNLMQRLSIAVDVASALEYLHQHGEMPIVHCDLKPSNVLLDDDMTALVGDFGLARFLMEFTTESSVKSTSTLGLRGSIGYIAPGQIDEVLKPRKMRHDALLASSPVKFEAVCPARLVRRASYHVLITVPIILEYGVANRVSTHGDVYSYGILLLELFTGKRPTDDKFKEGLSISKYVEMAFPGRVKDIVDARLFSRPEDAEANSDIQDLDDAGEGSMECITSVLRIGLSCSKDLPMARMQMGDVSRELQAIREAFLRKGTFDMKEKKKLSMS